jgi:hypothetical protein
MTRTMTTRRRATTLPELIVGLTVTALVALGVASILQAASYGTSSRREVRRLAVRVHEVRSRVDSAIRSARAVLATGNGYIVLWTGDTRADGHVNLSELQLIELSPTNQLTSYVTRFPASWTQAQIDAADVSYSPSADFASICQTAKNGSYFPGTLWSNDGSNFTVAPDKTPVQQAKLVTWSLSLASDLIAEPLVGSSALRVWVAPT